MLPVLILRIVLADILVSQSFKFSVVQLRALSKKANKFEKVKAKKCGSTMWREVGELSSLIREGKTSWEDLELDDIDIRLKWAGLFHRRKRTPGRFMMRLKIPNGELTSEQLRFMGTCIAKYGEQGCGDITTRANIQLRGIGLEDAEEIIEGLQNLGLSNVMSGMDNVRNITGSPIAGIDPHEIVDSRPLCHQLNAAITAHGKGNPELANLPRKINIGISTSRDDFAHCHINDVGLKVAISKNDEIGFNVELGGYFSIKRNVMSIDGDTFVRYDQVVPYCLALLEVFRDYGARQDRQKARLMWLVEEWGIEKFRNMIEARMGQKLSNAVPVEYSEDWQRRDVLGIHPQKQEKLFWVGACVPVGRLQTTDFFELAEVADNYGDGTVRLSVEENVIIPNVHERHLDEIREHPLFQRFPIEGGPLLRGLVSCTGAQFCSLALIETKNRALKIIQTLENELTIPNTVRIHWTGCPNSCGQAQVGDIGLMGAPAKLDGKAVEGVRIMIGGKIGEDPRLASDFENSVPCDEIHLLPKLRKILIDEFGAELKET